MRGTVTAFDKVVGLGEITVDDGEVVPFHCIVIADGSRDIPDSAPSRVRRVGKLGRYEADHVVSGMNERDQRIVDVIRALREGEVVTYGDIAEDRRLPGGRASSATSWQRPTRTCPGGESSTPLAGWCRATSASSRRSCDPKVSRSGEGRVRKARFGRFS